MIKYLFVILSLIYIVNGVLQPIPKYYASSDLVTWYEAKQRCEAAGDRLAIILNQGDNDAVCSVCSANGAGEACYIGLHDRPQENVWFWEHGPQIGSPPNWSGFQKFAPGEPNNYGIYNGVRIDEDCVEMWRVGGHVGQWNDRNCASPDGYRASYVCENLERRNYFRGSVPLTFLDAYAFCKERGSVLAAITDARDAIDAVAACQSQHCWTGLNDLAKQHDYKYLDGTAATYLPWAPGEPNNFADAAEHCVELLPNGQFNDLDCIEAPNGGGPFKRYPLCNPAPDKAIYSAKNDPLLKVLTDKFGNIQDDTINNETFYDKLFMRYTFISSGITIIALIVLAIIVSCIVRYYKGTSKIPYQNIKYTSSDSDCA